MRACGDVYGKIIRNIHHQHDRKNKSEMTERTRVRKVESIKKMT
jgi:hypothetical protein